jgi:hypothetical protein
MFVELPKDWLGQKAGTRIDVSETDAATLVNGDIAKSVPNYLLKPAIEKMMATYFETFTKNLDAVVNASIVEGVARVVKPGGCSRSARVGLIDQGRQIFFDPSLARTEQEVSLN